MIMFESIFITSKKGNFLKQGTKSTSYRVWQITWIILKQRTQNVCWWPSGLGSDFVTSVAWVTAVTQVQSRAQDLPHAVGMEPPKLRTFLLNHTIKRKRMQATELEKLCAAHKTDKVHTQNIWKKSTNQQVQISRKVNGAIV